VRSVLIPGFDAVKKAAMDAGALGCSISGSGPSMFALCKSRDDAERVSLQMGETFSDADIENENFVSRVGERGANIE
jgi:homoserine kinase